MKTIHLAQLGKPSPVWSAWIQGLVDIGFEIKAISPLKMELQTFHAQPNEVVLLDGRLPNLKRFVRRIHDQEERVCIIVATEVKSIAIKHKVMCLNSATYISGSLSVNEFVEAIKNVSAREMVE